MLTKNNKRKDQRVKAFFRNNKWIPSYLRGKRNKKVDKKKVIAISGLVGAALAVGGYKSGLFSPEGLLAAKQFIANPKLALIETGKLKPKYNTEIFTDPIPGLNLQTSIDVNKLPDFKGKDFFSTVAPLGESVKTKYTQNLRDIGEAIRDGRINNLTKADGVNPETNTIESNVLIKGQKLGRDIKYINVFITGRAGSFGASNNHVTYAYWKKKIHHKIDAKGFNKLETELLGENLAIGTSRTWSPIYDKYNEEKFNIYKKIYSQGYDPTTVEAAYTAYQYHVLNPDKPINFIGSSSGGFMANDAAIILESAGVPRDLIKVITFGGERNTATPEFPNALHFLDAEDQLARAETIFSQTTPTSINWDKVEAIPPGMRGHLASAYLTETADRIKVFIKQLPNSLVNKAALEDTIAKIDKLNKKIQGATVKLNEGTLPEDAIERVKRGIDANIKEIERLNAKLNKLRGDSPLDNFNKYTRLVNFSRYNKQNKFRRLYI